MDSQTREQQLNALAEEIERHGLRGPAQIFLGSISPISIIASQSLAVFRPLLPHGRWRNYVTALEDDTSWEALWRILERKAC